MTRGWSHRCRAAAAVAAVAGLLVACSIEQDLTPRVAALDDPAAQEVGSSPTDASTGEDQPAATTTDAPSESRDARGTGSELPDDGAPDTPVAPSDDATADGSTSTATTPPQQPASPASPDTQPEPEPGNRTPVAADDAVTTPEDTSTSIAVLGNDSDPDGDALSLQEVAGAAHGTTSISGTRVVYTPEPDYHGPDSFTYRVGDSRGGSDRAVVSVTVTPINDAPTAVPDGPYLVQRGGSVFITDLLDDDTDPEGDGLVIELVSGGQDGTVTLIDDTTVEYAHGGARNLTDSFRYRVFDGRDRSAPTTVSLDVNMPPVARNDSMEVHMTSADQLFTFNVITGAVGGDCCGSGESWTPGLDTDANNDSITYVRPLSTTRPYWMLGFQCNSAGTCRIEVQGCTGLAEPWTFNYTISDGRGGQDTATMSFRPYHSCIR